jgi:hypothetical protein
MAAPLLFMFGTSLVRAATPVIARALAKQGLTKATVSQARGKVTQTVTNIKQASKLKPKTKVVGKSKPASTKTGSPSPAPKPKPKGLKPTRNPGLAKEATKKGNLQKKAAVGTITTIASLPLMSAMEKKDNKPANASTPRASTSSKTRGKAPDRSKDTNYRQQRVLEKRGGIDANKTWKDVKSVAAAKSAGLTHFTGRDGKKKIAITKEELDKKGMSLNQYANSLRKK